MKFPNISHIYIVHCESLTDRYEYLKKVMTKFFPEDYYTFVVNTYKDTLTDEMIQQYYTLDESVRHKELSIIKEENNLSPRISKASLSCGINHLKIWEKIANGNDDRVLILEDDILFLEDTLSYMIEIMAEIRDEHDIVSLEDGAGLTLRQWGSNLIQKKQFTKLTMVGCVVLAPMLSIRRHV
jgi:GR25 family glycosyltransferase involved in LPS biosynthesis